MSFIGADSGGTGRVARDNCKIVYIRKNLWIVLYKAGLTWGLDWYPEVLTSQETNKKKYPNIKEQSFCHQYRLLAYLFMLTLKVLFFNYSYAVEILLLVDLYTFHLLVVFFQALFCLLCHVPSFMAINTYTWDSL